MVPVALLGSTIYLALQLLRSNLSHEKYLDEAQAKIQQLEIKLDELQTKRAVEQSESKKVIQASRSNRWWFF